ncbi:MAG: DMT family transporter [Dongiaceae bacterium]
MSAPEAAAPQSAARAPAGAPEIGQLAGLGLLIAITFFWGINWPAMKTAVGEIPPWTFRVICLAIGGAGMLAIARLGGLRFRIPRGELGPLLITGLFNITIWHICSAAGLVHISASRASIIAFTMPLWATLLAVPLLGERLTWRAVAGLALGLAGLAALVLPHADALLADPLGPLLMLLAAMSWAVGTVLAKHYRFTMPVSVFTGWQILLGGLPILAGMLIFERDFQPARVGVAAWGAALYAALIPTIFCQWGWFKLVRSFPAIAVSIGTLMIPVLGVLSSALALGEPVGLPEVAALALILAALFIVLILPALGKGGRRA